MHLSVLSLSWFLTCVKTLPLHEKARSLGTLEACADKYSSESPEICGKRSRKMNQEKSPEVLEQELCTNALISSRNATSSALLRF